MKRFLLILAISVVLLLDWLRAFARDVGERINATVFGFLHSQGLILCAVSLPNGATISIGSGYDTVRNVTAITNANPGVMTISDATGYAVGSIFELTSGWSRANGNVYRAATVVGTAIGIEGLNTTSTTIFPAGAGAGTVREVTAWTQVTQILDTQTNGGDQQFVTYSFLEDNAEHQIPTVKSPIAFNFTIGDDASLPHYSVLDAADSDRLQRVVRVVLPSGSVIYWSAYLTLQKTPTLQKNQVMGLKVTMSLINLVTRYAS
jgi:hypothetical protein